MLTNLFSSQARVSILKLFLFNPKTSYYQRQIATLTQQPIQGVQREVAKLTRLGLIERTVQGNRIYYQVNPQCTIYPELKRLFFKTVGIAEVLREQLKKNDTITVAFIYGSYATDKESISSDIDLLVIGSISGKELSGLLAPPKRELGREINFAVFPRAEFKKKLEAKDHFLTSVFKDQKIFIIGSEDELKNMVSTR
ncbi:MAG: nucleotidyltransferase domain-containing protein [bacterium]|nr:nucleotidyltransferase domain-containing protein [bacterium]